MSRERYWIILKGENGCIEGKMSRSGHRGSGGDDAGLSRILPTTIATKDADIYIYTYIHIYIYIYVYI